MSYIKKIADKITEDTYFFYELEYCERQREHLEQIGCFAAAVQSLSKVSGHINGLPLITFLIERAFNPDPSNICIATHAVNTLYACNHRFSNSEILQMLERILSEGIHYSKVDRFYEEEWLVCPDIDYVRSIAQDIGFEIEEVDELEIKVRNWSERLEEIRVRDIRAGIACGLLKHFFFYKRIPANIVDALISVVKGGSSDTKMRAAGALKVIDHDCAKDLLFPFLQEVLNTDKMQSVRTTAESFGEYRNYLGILKAALYILPCFRELTLMPKIAEAIDFIQHEDFWGMNYYVNDALSKLADSSDTEVTNKQRNIGEILSELVNNSNRPQVLEAFKITSDINTPSIHKKINEIVEERNDEIWSNLIHSENLRDLLVPSGIPSHINQEDFYLPKILLGYFPLDKLLLLIDEDSKHLSFCLWMVGSVWQLSPSKEILNVLNALVTVEWKD